MPEKKATGLLQVCEDVSDPRVFFSSEIFDGKSQALCTMWLSLRYFRTKRTVRQPWSGWPRTYKTTSGEHLVTLTSGQSVDDGLACARSFSNLKNKQKTKSRILLIEIYSIFTYFLVFAFFWIVSREDRKLERKKCSKGPQLSLNLACCVLAIWRVVACSRH